jgi:hypothetical protein
MQKESSKENSNLSDDDKISIIIKNELIITKAVLKGHQSIENDEFKNLREENKKLRTELGILK